MAAHNKSLERTFEPPPTFAVAKMAATSNAAQLGRYAINKNSCDLV